MYLEHFGLAEFPFNLTPDPRFFYPGGSHEDASVGLCNGIRLRQGVIVLTGEIGTGKTTLLSEVRAQCDPRVDAVIISNPPNDFAALLRLILVHLGVQADQTENSEMISALTTVLTERLQEDRLVAVLIDDAHELDAATLQEIAALARLESNQKKLLQIVLAGRPELKKRLGTPALRSLAEVVLLQYELDPLKQNEVARYIEHRLARAGYGGKLVFTPEAVKVIARRSNGIPGSINILCDNALLAAYMASKKISAETVDEVARELQLARGSESTSLAAAASERRGSPPLDDGITQIPDNAGNDENESYAGAETAPQRKEENRELNRSWNKAVLVLLGLAVAGFIAIFYFSQRQLDRTSPSKLSDTAPAPAPKEEGAGTSQPPLENPVVPRADEERSASPAVEPSAAGGSATEGPLVYMHISQERDRATVELINRALRDNGYRVPVVRSVRDGTEGDVRVFFSSDKRAAQNVKALVEKELARRGHRMSLQLLERDGRKFEYAAPGKIEVWLPPLTGDVAERGTSVARPYSPRDRPLERFGAD